MRTCAGDAGIREISAVPQRRRGTGHWPLLVGVFGSDASNDIRCHPAGISLRRHRRSLVRRPVVARPVARHLGRSARLGQNPLELQ